MSFIIPGIQPKVIDKIGLIDADCIKYRVISKLNPNLPPNFREIAELTEFALAEFRDLFTAKAVLFCFSGSTTDNFRWEIAYDRMYKGKREGGNMSLVKERIVKHIQQRQPSLLFNALEADDLLAMLQDEDTFIYSEDKDLLQVPGTHWNIKKKEFFEITPSDGFRFLMSQMILGDTVDNIAGLKGYGPAKCKDLLTDNTDTIQMPFNVLTEYIKVNGLVDGLDMFAENYNLLKLRDNRGEYFQEKFALAFATLESLKSEE